MHEFGLLAILCAILLTNRRYISNRVSLAFFRCWVRCFTWYDGSFRGSCICLTSFASKSLNLVSLNCCFFYFNFNSVSEVIYQSQRGLRLLVMLKLDWIAFVFRSNIFINYYFLQHASVAHRTSTLPAIPVVRWHVEALADHGGVLLPSLVVRLSCLPHIRHPLQRVRVVEWLLLTLLAFVSQPNVHSLAPEVFVSFHEVGHCWAWIEGRWRLCTRKKRSFGATDHPKQWSICRVCGFGNGVDSIWASAAG